MFDATAGEKEFALYEKTLKACSIAISKESRSVWQQQNAIGRNPEAIVIAKESASNKLYYAVGKIIKLQKATGMYFVSKKQSLDDDTRFELCEDFYADALEALSEWRTLV